MFPPGTLAAEWPAPPLPVMIQSADTQKSGRAANVWMQPLDGTAASPVTHFTEGEIFDFRPSPDGKWLAMSRGSISNDVVLITRR